MCESGLPENSGFFLFLCILFIAMLLVKISTRLRLALRDEVTAEWFGFGKGLRSLEGFRVVEMGPLISLISLFCPKASLLSSWGRISVAFLRGELSPSAAYLPLLVNVT